SHRRAVLARTLVVPRRLVPRAVRVVPVVRPVLGVGGAVLGVAVGALVGGIHLLGGARGVLRGAVGGRGGGVLGALGARPAAGQGQQRGAGAERCRGTHTSPEARDRHGGSSPPSSARPRAAAGGTDAVRVTPCQKVKRRSRDCHEMAATGVLAGCSPGGAPCGTDDRPAPGAVSPPGGGARGRRD